MSSPLFVMLAIFLSIFTCFYFVSTFFSRGTSVVARKSHALHTTSWNGLITNHSVETDRGPTHINRQGNCPLKLVSNRFVKQAKLLACIVSTTESGFCTLSEFIIIANQLAKLFSQSAKSNIVSGKSPSGKVLRDSKHHSQLATSFPSYKSKPILTDV